jgi:hypothetical protein
VNRVVVKSQSRQLQAQRSSRLEAAAGFVNEVGEDRGEGRYQNIIINSPVHKLVRSGMHGGCSWASRRLHTRSMFHSSTELFHLSRRGYQIHHQQAVSSSKFNLEKLPGNNAVVQITKHGFLSKQILERC